MKATGFAVLILTSLAYWVGIICGEPARAWVRSWDVTGAEVWFGLGVAEHPAWSAAQADVLGKVVQWIFRQMGLADPSRTVVTAIVALVEQIVKWLLDRAAPPPGDIT